MIKIGTLENFGPNSVRTYGQLRTDAERRADQSSVWRVSMHAAQFYGLITMQPCLRADSLRQSESAEVRFLSGPARKR